MASAYHSWGNVRIPLIFFYSIVISSVLSIYNKFRQYSQHEMERIDIWYKWSDSEHVNVHGLDKTEIPENATHFDKTKKNKTNISKTKRHGRNKTKEQKKKLMDPTNEPHSRIEGDTGCSEKVSILNEMPKCDQPESNEMFLNDEHPKSA